MALDTGYLYSYLGRVSSNPPESSTPELHVFRSHGDLQGLQQIAPEHWQQIVQHTRELGPANTVVRLIVITGRGSSCETVEALQLQTDNFGFMLTWDASTAQTLPALKIAGQIKSGASGRRAPARYSRGQHSRENENKVIDSRQRFLHRYLSHRHSWQPAPELIAEAITRAGYITQFDN